MYLEVILDAFFQVFSHILILMIVWKEYNYGIRLFWRLAIII